MPGKKKKKKRKREIIWYYALMKAKDIQKKKADWDHDIINSVTEERVSGKFKPSGKATYII